METTIKNGSKVYYIEDGQVYSGTVIDIEHIMSGLYFYIDSYGGCEGNYRISIDEIGNTVFETKDAAEKKLKKRNR